MNMNIELDIENLKTKSLFVATPMYGGNCSGMYTKATNDLSMICAKHGIELKFYYLFNESLITRARNYCVDEFLRSGCTHLMFIDSDIGFNYKDVLHLMQITDSATGMDIVTGAYPKKTISWEKIKKASDMGYGADNPFQLEHFVGDFVFNPDSDIKSFKLNEPVKIKEGGTGFMMIHRDVFAKYAEAYPELKYKPDHARTEHFDGTREITAFFDTVIDPESKRYLSEDYMFSYYARRIGLNVWLCPWIQLKHVGTYTFGGSLGAMAAIQASPTASKESNKKTYLTKNQEPAKTDGMNRKQRRAQEKMRK